MLKLIKKTIRKLHKSKTLVFAFILSFTAPMLESFPTLKLFLGDNYGLAFVALSCTVGALRFLTTKAVSDK